MADLEPIPIQLEKACAALNAFNVKIAIFVSLLFQCPEVIAASFFQQCESNENNLQKIALANRYPNLKNEARFPRVYFLLPRRLKGESFKAIEANIANLKKLGIEELWVSNTNEQTTNDFFGSYNDHGYWPKDLSLDSIDTKMGGKTDFLHLLKELQRNQIGFMPDAVINHLGYGEKFEISYRTETGQLKRLSVKDGDSFFREKGLDNPPDDVMRRPEEVHSQLEVLEAIDKAAQFRLAGLPSYNHANPEVMEFLYNSYRERIDLGAKTIRVDACKHIPVKFVEAFVKRLSDYSQRKHGRKVKFVMEYLFHKYFAIDAVADHMHDKVPGAEVYFFDYPLANELRALSKPEYSFEFLSGFIKHRETGIRQHSRLVPIMEDHDFLSPIRSHTNHLGDNFVREMVYTLSEFVSQNPTVLYHGAETAEARKDHRSDINKIEANGAIGNILNKISKELDKTRAWPENAITDVMHADQNTWIASRSGNGQTIFAFIHKGEGEFHRNIRIPNLPAKAQLKQIHGRGDTFCHNTGVNGEVSFRSSGPSIDYFKIEYN